MWQKISMFPLMARFAVKSFAEDFKNDERGLSGVVVAVLLVLVAVLAVILLWALLGDWIEETWTNLIEGTAEDGLQERPVD